MNKSYITKQYLAMPVGILITLALVLGQMAPYLPEKPQCLSPASAFSPQPPIQSLKASQNKEGAEFVLTEIISSVLRSPYRMAHEVGHVVAGLLTGRIPSSFNLGFLGRPHVEFHRPVGAWGVLLVAPAGLIFELALGALSVYCTFVLGTNSALLFAVGCLGLFSGLVHLFYRIKFEQRPSHQLSDWEIFTRAFRRAILRDPSVNASFSRFNMDSKLREEVNRNKTDSSALYGLHVRFGQRGGWGMIDQAIDIYLKYLDLVWGATGDGIQDFYLNAVEIDQFLTQYFKDPSAYPSIKYEHLSFLFAEMLRRLNRYRQGEGRLRGLIMEQSWPSEGPLVRGQIIRHIFYSEDSAQPALLQNWQTIPVFQPTEEDRDRHGNLDPQIRIRKMGLMILLHLGVQEHGNLQQGLIFDFLPIDFFPDNALLDLRGMDLRGISPFRMDMPGADLRGADLRSASLTGTNRPGGLMGSDLRDADLRGINLHRAYLGGADLRGADLHGANLTAAKMRKARVTSKQLSDLTRPGFLSSEPFTEKRCSSLIVDAIAREEISLNPDEATAIATSL